MKTYSQTELQTILEKHKLWLEGGGKKGERANLYGANLYGANLFGAYLPKANLSESNLSGANLSGAILPDYDFLPKGAFVAWKKVKNGVILKLQIHEDSRRTCTPVGRKCRTDKVTVLGAIAPYGSAYVGDLVSTHDPSFTYKVGETVTEPNYDPDIRVECTKGIHFFLNREEAEAY